MTGRLHIQLTEKVVSDKNKAVILPKGRSYSLHRDKTGSFPVINFDCLNFPCNDILSFTVLNPAAYIKEYEKMKALSLFSGNRAEIMSIFYGILHRILLDNTSVSRLAPAISLIEKEFSNPKLTNSDLARECSISEIYFRKIFTEEYKLSPKQYLTEVRINKAKQLLTDGFLKINAVAAQCGFDALECDCLRSVFFSAGLLERGGSIDRRSAFYTMADAAGSLFENGGHRSRDSKN